MAVQFKVFSISFVSNEAFGIGFDLLLERVKDSLTVLSIFSGLLGIETYDVATAVQRYLFDFKGGPDLLSTPPQEGHPDSDLDGIRHPS